MCANYNIIQSQQQMAANDEKESIIGLPLPERTVAVALKHIFDKIKQLEEEENEEVQKIHHSFISKFKEVEHNASRVITGNPIDESLLADSDKYFTEVERSEVKQIAQKNKGIEAYWLTVLISFYEEELSISDKEIAATIVDISSNVTKESLEITFKFSASEWLPACTITRRFILQDGVASKVEGDNAKWLKENGEGIFNLLLSELTGEEIVAAFSITGEFINEIVPYSLEYFLGINGGEGQEAEEGDQQEEQESEEKQPSKKVKQ